MSGGSGRMSTGTSGGYVQDDMISVTCITQTADIDVRFDFMLPVTETPSLNVILRSDAQNLISGNCYSLDIRAGGLSIVEARSWNYATLASASKPLATQTWLSCRVAATGGLIRARIWPVGQAEPTSWDVSTSYGYQKKTGYWGFSVPGPGEAGGRTVQIDNLTRLGPWQRDSNTVPFASASVWNTPVGTGAQYVPLSMTVPTHGYSVDDGFIVLTPSAPLRNLIDRKYWWPYPQTGITPVDSGIDVHIPDDYLIPPPPGSSYPNRATAMIQANGLVREFQYTVRESAGSDVTYHESLRATYDLTGDGLTGPNGFGAHGGSGMTVLGGTIRDTELSNPGPIGHALALTINTWKWATAQGGAITNGYRWPAIAADSNWATAYGSVDGGAHSKDGVGMGSLLAVPASVDLAALGLETTLGWKIAEAMQQYGGYIVDSTGSASNDDLLWNVTAEALERYPMLDAWGDPAPPDTPYRRDMDRILPMLALVDNNTPTTIGGGGVPLVPWSPPPE